MDSSYTFSYYTLQSIPKLKKRDWWRIFSSDTIIYEDTWVRIVISDITEQQKEYLLKAFNANFSNEPLSGLFLKLMRGHAKYIQLEANLAPSPYIKVVQK